MTIYTNAETFYSVYLSGLYLSHHATESHAKESAMPLWDPRFQVAGRYVKHEPGEMFLVGNRVQSDPNREDSWDFHVQEVPWLKWVEFYPEERDHE